MADGFPATPGSGATIATDDIGGQHYQRVKLAHGVDGSAVDASAAAPLPVTGPATDAQLRATPLAVAGPLTDAQLRASAVPVVGGLTDTQLRATAVPVSDGGASLTVDGTFWQATQPVSMAALPLPAGAATEATLAGQAAGCATVATTQVTVDTTATGVQIVAARAGRRAVTVTNLGTTDVWVGGGNVSPTTGELLVGVKGASQTYVTASALRAVVASGTQAVSVREEY